MRTSKQREAILLVLRGSKDHPTADLICERVRKEFPNISLGTVYRDLGQLVEAGEITIVDCCAPKVHYEGNLNQHIHFLCTSCGRIIDVFCSPTVPSEITEMGLTVLSQKTVYYGICKQCRDK